MGKSIYESGQKFLSSQVGMELGQRDYLSVSGSGPGRGEVAEEDCDVTYSALAAEDVEVLIVWRERSSTIGKGSEAR